MNDPKPSYEDLQNKIKILELELSNLKKSDFRQDYEDFVQYSQSIYYQYSNLRGGLFWSNRVKDILGFSPEEIKENPFLWNNSIHPDDLPLVQKAIEDYERGADYNIEYRIRTKSGKWIWLHDHFIRKIQIGDEIIIDGNALDITLQKEAELALRESEERFRNYINSTSDIVFTLDTEQRHNGIFGDWAEKSGLSKEFFLGKTTKELLGDKADVHEEANKKALNGEYVVYEWSNVIGDTTIYFQTSLSPLYKENKIIGIIGVGRNITNLKKIEFALRESEESIQKQNIELIKLNSDKNRFISILAHDLKNPFNNIRGLLKLIQENLSSYNEIELKKIIDMIHESVEKYHNLLEDILHWARTQSGNFSIEGEKLLFIKTCTEVIENLQAMATQKDISIQLEAKNSEIVFTDKNILTTILRNLISNSIKFTNQGGHIQISLEQNNFNSIITVSDNGIGISPERLKTLFEISQVHSTPGTEKENGTGLGLMLCKELIEKQSGKIWVKSQPGKGSQFIFSIPNLPSNRDTKY
jgi:PAS domain S-box-containing protein